MGFKLASSFNKNMTKVNITFSLFSDDLDPDIVTSALQIKPTSSWKKGMALPYNKSFLGKEGCWEISTGYQDSLDIGEQVKILYQTINPKRREFATIVKEHNLSSKFDIVVKIKDGQIPGITLENDILDLAHALDAIFDFDIYIT